METSTQAVTGTPGQNAGINMNVVIRTIEKVTVKNVVAGGSANLELRIEKQSATMNGQPFSGMPDFTGKSMPLKMTPLGPSGEVKGFGASGGMAGGVDPASLQFLGLPKEPVHAGSSWASTLALGVEKVILHNTLSNLSTRNGATIAGIHTTGKVDIGKIAKGAKAMKGAIIKGALILDMRWQFNVTSGCVENMTSKGPLNIDINFPYSQTGKPVQAQTKGTQAISVRKVG